MKRISAVIAFAAIRPLAGSANVRAMNSDAIVRVRSASCHGTTASITVLIATYSTTTTAIDSTIARGMVRSGDRISSPR